MSRWSPYARVGRSLTTMEMPKHSDEDKARFRSLVTEGPGVEIKPMFGSVGAFVNGNMYAGLFGSAERAREHIATLPPKVRKAKK